MRIRTVIISLIFCLTAFCQAQAKFAARDTTNVPVDRVLKNFERRYSTNHSDVEAVYHLARIHSLAYATHLPTIDINRKSDLPFYAYPGCDSVIPTLLVPATNAQIRSEALQHLTNAIGYYREAKKMMAGSKFGSSNDWMELPINVGLAWCLEQNGERADAIAAYRTALVIAWNKEIEHQPSPFHKWFSDEHPHIGPGVCYSEEIIHNLLPLLDSTRDAREIAQLNADQKKIDAMPRAITPILVSLEPATPFERLVNPDAAVPFDLDGSGLLRQWGWITPRAAWLVFDPHQSGQITSGLQMFGSVTFWIFWRDGYDALSALDDNGDGVLTGDELRGLSLWQDKNGDGICDPGEVRPVADWGITAIECGGRTNECGVLNNPRGVRMRDGTARATYDWIVPAPVKF